MSAPPRRPVAAHASRARHLLAGALAVSLTFPLAACASTGSAGGSASVGGDTRPKDIATLSMADLPSQTLEEIDPLIGAEPSSATSPEAADGSAGATAAGGMSAGGTGTEGGATDGTSVETPAGAGTFEFELVPAGTPGTTNDWEVTVHSLTDPLAPASEFITPDEGRRYVGMDVEVRNLHEDARTFSSSYSLDLLLPDGSQQEVAIGTLHEPSAPSGEMKSGQIFRGLVIFELPQAVDPTTAALVLGFNFSVADPLYFAVPAARR